MQILSYPDHFEAYQIYKKLNDCIAGHDIGHALQALKSCAENVCLNVYGYPNPVDIYSDEEKSEK